MSFVLPRPHRALQFTGALQPSERSDDPTTLGMSHGPPPGARDEETREAPRPLLRRAPRPERAGRSPYTPSRPLHTPPAALDAVATPSSSSQDVTVLRPSELDEERLSTPTAARAPRAEGSTAAIGHFRTSLRGPIPVRRSQQGPLPLYAWVFLALAFGVLSFLLTPAAVHGLEQLASR